MSYGAHMAAAAQALARAHTRLTDPVPELGQRAVVAQTRIGIYHSLEIQTVVLGAVFPGLLPRADRITTEAEWHTDRPARQWYTGPPLRDPIERRIYRTRRPPDPDPQHPSPHRSM